MTDKHTLDADITFVVRGEEDFEEVQLFTPKTIIIE
jgi:hypothetical protein